MHYTLRLQFGPHHPSGRIREELDMGHEPLEEVRTWLEAIRPWKKALEGMGFSVSLNPWHTMADHGGLEGEAGLRRSVPPGPRGVLRRGPAPLRPGGIPDHMDRRRHPAPQPRPPGLGRVFLPPAPGRTGVEAVREEVVSKVLRRKSLGNGSPGASYWTARPPGFWTEEASESS